MSRETVIANYINAVENILTAFHFNINPDKADIATVTLKTKEFINALRELYLSSEKNKDDKYKVIYEVVRKANFYIAKENFETNPLVSYWSVVISNLELAYSHISELHFKETDYFYPFPENTKQSQQTEKPKPEQEQPKTLSSIITHKEPETIVSGIKTQYKNIKGKRLKLLLIALQELELLPKERIAKKFHTLCKNEFDWEIASYNAMNGYNFNSHTDTDEVEGIKEYIKTLSNTK